MPVFLRTKNLRFVIYSNDHVPEHCHIKGPNAEMKIDLTSLKIISSKGFSKKDSNKILSFIKDKKDLLLNV